MDVLDLLASQHDDVDQLIERLEASEGDRRDVFAELADKLAAHSAVEETIFYPAAVSKSTTDQLHEAVEEHLAMKRVLADMLELDPEEAEFDAKLAILKEEVSHHAHDEEEGKLFPKLRRELDVETRAALANEVLAKFEELITQEPRRHVPAETAEAAPLPVA